MTTNQAMSQEEVASTLRQAYLDAFGQPTDEVAEMLIEISISRVQKGAIWQWGTIGGMRALDFRKPQNNDHKED